jgi:hypothetical protein
MRFIGGGVGHRDLSQRALPSYLAQGSESVIPQPEMQGQPAGNDEVSELHLREGALTEGGDGSDEEEEDLNEDELSGNIDISDHSDIEEETESEGSDSDVERGTEVSGKDSDDEVSMDDENAEDIMLDND